MTLRGILVLLLFNLLGEAIARLAGLPIPGPVIGLLLLFFALLLFGGPPQDLERTSSGMIKLLPLFLITPSAGVFFLGSAFSSQWPAFAGAIIGGTLLTLIFSGLLMKFLVGGK